MTNRAASDLPALKNALADRWQALVQTLCPQVRITRGEARFNDFSGKAGANPKYSVSARGYYDFSSDRGGSHLDLIMAARGDDFRGACEWAREWLGWPEFKSNKPMSVRPEATGRSGEQSTSATADCSPLPTVALPSIRTSNSASRTDMGDLPPISGTPAAAYLYFRGINPNEAPDTLRYDPAHSFGADGKHPALIAEVVSLTTSNPQAHLAIALRPDGRAKAAINSPKRFRGPAKGGAILIGDALTAPVIWVVEGLEDGLSLHQSEGQPVVVALSAGAVKTLPLLETWRTLYIVPDRDEVGIAAAKTLHHRALEAGKTARLVLPKGKDVNDAHISTPRLATASPGAPGGIAPKGARPKSEAPAERTLCEANVSVSDKHA